MMGRAKIEGVGGTGVMPPGLICGVEGVGEGLAVPGMWGGMEDRGMEGWGVKGFRDGESLVVPGVWGGMEDRGMGTWRVKGFGDGGME